MTTTVVVASREIIDAVYRAAKMAGAPSGMASLLGRSSCFAVGQLDRSLRSVVDHLVAGQLPPFGFPEITRAQLGDGEPVVVDGCAVGDLAYHGIVACRRGMAVDFHIGGSLLQPVEWLDAALVEHRVSAVSVRAVPVDLSLLERVDQRHVEVLANGVDVDAQEWDRLAAAAHQYLVPEALIDAVDTPTD